MRTENFLVALTLLVALTQTASAGIIFGRKPAKPVNPTERVQELLHTVQTAKDERKVTDAISDLREFDANTHPQIVPVLVEALRRDPRFGVRLEAAHALGRIRPVLLLAGQALEEASTNDSALRVRWQARTSLMWCNTAGYQAIKKQHLEASLPRPGKNLSSSKTPIPVGVRPPINPLPAPAASDPLPSDPLTNLANLPRPFPRGPAQAGNMTHPSTAEPPLAQPLVQHPNQAPPPPLVQPFVQQPGPMRSPTVPPSGVKLHESVEPPLAVPPTVTPTPANPPGPMLNPNLPVIPPLPTPPAPGTQGPILPLGIGVGQTIQAPGVTTAPVVPAPPSSLPPEEGPVLPPQN